MPPMDAAIASPAVARQAAGAAPTRGPKAGKKVVARVAEAAVAEGPRKGLLARLTDFVLWLQLGVPGDGPSHVKVLENPSARFPTLGEREAAQAALLSGAETERARVAKLGARASAYADVAALLAEKPLGRAALMAMLRDGRLTRDPDLRGTGDVLDHLVAIARGQVVAGLDKATLLDHLVQELAVPVKIAQGGKSTCAATAATIVSARKHPAEIARLVAGLAQPAGRVQLARGGTLAREKDWADNDDGGRTLSQRLLQPALMEFGNGFQDYDNKTDANRLGPIPLGLAGLTAGGTRRVMEALTDDGWRAVTLYRWRRAAVLAELKAAVERGAAVPVAMTWEEGLHQLVVVGVGGGYVELMNPAGSRDRITWDAFAARVQRALLPRL